MEKTASFLLEKYSFDDAIQVLALKFEPTEKWPVWEIPTLIVAGDAAGSLFQLLRPKMYVEVAWRVLDYPKLGLLTAFRESGTTMFRKRSVVVIDGETKLTRFANQWLTY